MLYFASLNSGSNGNCYYVGNADEAVLIDAGISCREIEKRMARLGLSIDRVKAIFISHEHSDHISGLCTMVKRYKLPVYISSGTLRGCRFTLDKHLVHHFSGNQQINIGALTVSSFSKAHDANEPYSFTVSQNGATVGVFTDLGIPCNNLVHHFSKCHAAFLESNYDENMLENGNYPYHLKKRIRGGHGHLSNAQALEVFNAHRPAFMSHLVLSHLSKNNNCPTLVEQLFKSHANGVNIIVASRYEETPLFQIGTQAINMKFRKTLKSTAQLAFAFA